MRWTCGRTEHNQHIYPFYLNFAPVRWIIKIMKTQDFFKIIIKNISAIVQQTVSECILWHGTSVPIGAST